MLKTTTTDAVMLLTQALHTLPMEPDPRSDFFVQWRSRSAESIERIFADDLALLQEFKEIEFSPRRLTRDAEKDEQLKLDACLAGCAQARLLLERLIGAVNQQMPALTPAVQAPVMIKPPPPPQPEQKNMHYAALCASIAQAVKCDEIDDAGSVLAASAQLLRQLTVGLADPALRIETERIMAKLAPGDPATRNRLEWEQADVFVWSVLMALGELKRCA